MYFRGPSPFPFYSHYLWRSEIVSANKVNQNFVVEPTYVHTNWYHPPLCIYK